jgi:predicted DNA-binding transcriptional regulator AlpA
MNQPQPDTRTPLLDLIPSVTHAARQLGVSPVTIYRWAAKNAVPPHRAATLARLLNMPEDRLAPYVMSTTTPSPVLPKSEDDFEAINDAYNGVETASTLSPWAIKIALARWGDRWPTLYNTLHELKCGVLSVPEATQRLGVTKSALHALRRRYGMATPRSKLTQAMLMDVLSGVKTVKSVAEDTNLTERSVRRALKALKLSQGQQ